LAQSSPWIRGSAVAVAAGYPLLMWWHLAGMLQKPHYQFVIVLPVLLLALLRSREQTQPIRTSYRGAWFFLLGLGAAAALLILASLMWSPWGAMLSAWVAGFCLLWFMTGWGGISTWFPAWLMCGVLLPLPFGWDERLTLILRGFTTRVTSQVLDLFG